MERERKKKRLGKELVVGARCVGGGVQGIADRASNPSSAEAKDSQILRVHWSASLAKNQQVLGSARDTVTHTQIHSRTEEVSQWHKCEDLSLNA